MDDDAGLEKLQQILLFKALEFPLRDIAAIICDKRDNRNGDKRR